MTKSMINIHILAKKGELKRLYDLLAEHYDIEHETTPEKAFGRGFQHQRIKLSEKN